MKLRILLAFVMIIALASPVSTAKPRRCLGRNVTIQGTPSRDVRFGTVDKDVIHVGRGSDFVSALDGNDRVCGGRGPDTLDGDMGFDRISGGKGEDECGGERQQKCE